MYLEKVNIDFLYIMQHLDTSGTLFQEPKSVHMHVQYLHVHTMHTRVVPAPASSIERPLRGT